MPTRARTRKPRAPVAPNTCTNLYQFIRLRVGPDVSDREVSRRWTMEWKSFIALKQGRRRMPRIDDLERLAAILDVDATFVFQVARGSPAEEVAALIGREAGLRALLERVADCVFTIDREGKIQDANEQMAKLLGQSVRKLIGRPLLELVTAESVRQASKYLAAARDGEAQSIELEFAGSGHVPRRLEIATAPIRDRAGATIGAQAIARDVTERTKLIQELATSRALMKTIFVHVPAACILFEADGTISAANPLVETVCPFTAAELVGMKATDAFGDPGPVGCPVTRAFGTRKVEQQLSWVMDRAGHRKYVHRTAGPVGQADKVVRVIEIMVDVTDQVQHGDIRVLSLWREQIPSSVTTIERRTSPRAPVAFIAKLRVGRSVHDVKALNLGAGGMFIETDAKVQVGTRVELSWVLPVDGIPVRARGVAAWSQSSRSGVAGIGVRFTEIEPRDALEAS